MLQKSTLQFLKELGKNNNKPWFEANRKKYEAAKEDVHQFVSALINGIAVFDTLIGELEAKKCLFRINRDVRFSANKAPYKTNMGAWMNVGGKKVWNGGYYFHVEPGKSFIAAGMYQPSPEWLAKIRQEIDYNLKDFEKIIKEKKFVATFGGMSKTADMVLSRPPKGYDISNPAIEHLKHKSFVATLPVTDAELLDKNLVKNAVAKFKLLYPFVQFFNKAVDE